MFKYTEQIAYHALALGTQSSYSQLKKLWNQFDSWQKAWELTSHRYKIDPQKEFKKLEQQGVRLTLRNDSDFPKLLREIPLAPFGLYVKGKISDLPQVAIIGTRRATMLGKKVARDFSKKLAQSGVGIVSGLALGVDAEAHRGALESGGATIAVLARGLGYIYPSIHNNLAEEIITSGGALISEYPPGTSALPYRFLERNRIVSGLSRGVLVVECPERSGVVATTRFAVEQNREVWVIPGSIRDKNYTGSHKLIKEGAALVTEPLEILDMLGIKPLETKIELKALAPNEERLLNILREAGRPLSVDKISIEANLDTRTVSRTITYLIMKEIITETPRGFITH